MLIRVCSLYLSNVSVQRSSSDTPVIRLIIRLSMTRLFKFAFVSLPNLPKLMDCIVYQYICCVSLMTPSLTWLNIHSLSVLIQYEICIGTYSLWDMMPKNNRWSDRWNRRKRILIPSLFQGSALLCVNPWSSQSSASNLNDGEMEKMETISNNNNTSTWIIEEGSEINIIISAIPSFSHTIPLPVQSGHHCRFSAKLSAVDAMALRSPEISLNFCGWAGCLNVQSRMTVAVLLRYSTAYCTIVSEACDSLQMFVLCYCTLCVF